MCVCVWGGGEVWVCVGRESDARDDGNRGHDNDIENDRL